MLSGWFEAPFRDTRITSANVHGKESRLGYVAGPFGVMLLQSIVNSYFNKYLTDTLGFTVSRGLWIAGFMVVFLFFFDIDKRMPEVPRALIQRKKAECAAKGIPYVSHEEQMKAEIAQQQKEAARKTAERAKARK